MTTTPVGGNDTEQLLDLTAGNVTDDESESYEWDDETNNSIAQAQSNRKHCMSIHDHIAYPVPAGDRKSSSSEQQIVTEKSKSKQTARTNSGTGLASDEKNGELRRKG